MSHETDDPPADEIRLEVPDGTSILLVELPSTFTAAEARGAEAAALEARNQLQAGVKQLVMLVPEQIKVRWLIAERPFEVVGGG